MNERPSRMAGLYASHIEGATRLAFLLTGTRELAEDLAQDSFVKATSRFQHLRSEDAFEGYLMKTVVNSCRAHWRRNKVEQTHAEKLAREPRQAVRQPDVAQRLAIMDALDALPLRQRTAVVLRHYNDLSERRTADLMGCTVGTVKTLTSRGLATLRERTEV